MDPAEIEAKKEASRRKQQEQAEKKRLAKEAAKKKKALAQTCHVADHIVFYTVLG